MRIGIGYDIHRLVEGCKLVLGGVEIPHHKGLLGHSDADVLLHALIDAVLGAAALGDIGRHFPDDDSQYKNISSLILLEKTCRLVMRGGFAVQQLDTVIIAEQPRLAAYIPQMRANISRTLKLNISMINVKATTHEGLSPIGK